MAKAKSTKVSLLNCSNSQAATIVFMSLLSNYRILMKGGKGSDYIVPFLVGPPAIGKSELVGQVCRLFSQCLALTPEKEQYIASVNPLLLEFLSGINPDAPLQGEMKGVKYWTHNLFAMGQEGFEGWQIPSDDRLYMTQTVPDWMRLCALGPSRDKKFQTDLQVIFLDEFAQADVRLQVLAAAAMTGRGIQSRPMCDHWFFIAAGNGAEDNSASQELPSHVASRMMHVHVFPTRQDTEVFISSNGKVTSTDEYLKPFPLTDLPDNTFLYPVLEAFLMDNPSLCYEQDAKVRCNEKSWPSLRNYVKVSSLMYISDYLISKGFDKPFIEECLRQAITGLIGSDTAMKLVDFYRYGQHVTPISTIVKTPLTAPIPQEPQPFMVTMLQCVQEVCNPSTKMDKASKILDYILRFAPESLTVAMVKIAHSGSENGKRMAFLHPGVNKWAEENVHTAAFSNTDSIRASLANHL